MSTTVLEEQTNLITNGDFEAGNTDFLSNYKKIKGGYTNPGEYNVISNPKTDFTNGYVSFGDHTSGHGLMLFADGGSSNKLIWSQSVLLPQDAEVTFSAWIANAYNRNNAKIALTVDGHQIGSSFSASSAGVWEEFTTSLNTGDGGDATIAIIDTNPAPLNTGNDVAIDDISLNIPEPVYNLIINDVAGDGVITFAEKQAGVTITGTGTPYSEITLSFFTNDIVYDVQPEPVIGQTTTNSNGTWEYTLTPEDYLLPNGTETIIVASIDQYGNQNDAIPVDIQIDSQLTTPIIDSLSFIDILQRNAGVTITGTADANTNITLSFSENDSIGTTVTNSDGIWEYTLADENYSFADGVETIYVVANDPVDESNVSESTEMDVQISHFKWIVGDDSKNKLVGGKEDNLIAGLGGADTVTGGKGADLFKYYHVSDSGVTTSTRDKITDFKHSEGDLIDLSEVSTDAPFDFIGNQPFSKTDASGQVRFDSKTGILYGSTNSDSKPEFSILLSGVKSLIADDLILSA